MTTSSVSNVPGASAPKGDTATAVVESLTHDARGVARIEGKTTFVTGALPGETVRFRYHGKKSRYDTGTLLEVLKPSPDRVTPPCPQFGVCGGCSLQHLSPSAQVLAKQRVLAETLEHIGRVQPARWLPPVEGPVTGYRRRARLGARLVPKKGGVLVGFREHNRSFITPLSHCLTLEPSLAALLPAFRDVITRLSRPDRVPQIEVSAGDTTRAAVFRHLEPLTDEDEVQLRTFAQTHDITVYVQSGGVETIEALWPRPAPELRYTLVDFNVTLAFQPSDFIQVNSVVNRALVAQALTLLEPSPGDRVVDLFCGLGNFTLALARRAGQVTGYEADAGLIERATINARRNGLQNVDFRTANLYEPGACETWLNDHPDKLLLDPPRAGAIEVLKAITVDGPRRIVYVSCNPATLARDSEYLVHGLGYRLEAAGIADMFPHTSHVESIALFVRQ